jgi:cell division protein FtsB
MHETGASSPVWMLPFGLLVFTVVAVPLHILDQQGLPRYRALRAELSRLHDNNERVRNELRDLKREVDALKSDPHAVERIARDELGMVRKGEIVFQF